MSSMMRDAILSLGMEDEIQLPDLVLSEELRAATDFTGDRSSLIDTMVQLLSEKRIVVLLDAWPDDPIVQSPEDAEVLLRDERSYERGTADEHLVYFENVLNRR